jgi:hypothetical protein
MKPTIGRIVIYRFHDGDERGAEAPAMVVNVRDNGNVDLNLFCNKLLEISGHAFNGPAAMVCYDGNVPEGTGPGTWHWPPRV